MGGEQETPEFEDYQVSLAFSGYARDFTQRKAVFRPLFDDTDSGVRVQPKTASHICIRGNLLRATFVNAIRIIAQPGCLFTYFGDAGSAQKAKQVLGGTVLEEDVPDGNIVIRL